MISLQDWAEIRHLHGSEGLSIRAIAKRLGVSREAVARAISSQSPPRYLRRPVVSSFDAFEPRVRGLLTEFPQMPATVIAERVGWSGSPSWFRNRSRCCDLSWRQRIPRIGWTIRLAIRCNAICGSRQRSFRCLMVGSRRHRCW